MHTDSSTPICSDRAIAARTMARASSSSRDVYKRQALGKQEATHLIGGDRLDGPGYERGYYVTPALFTDVTQQMRIAREEIFGPVSYTHLDVYKRQWPAPPRAPRCS